MKNPLFSGALERVLIVSLPLVGLWVGVIALG
jgi:hypothetical protein